MGKGKTLYTQAYHSNKTKFHYCDCAGFLRTRELEEDILSSISIKLAVHLASKVTAALVVIDHNTITTDRGAGLIKLSQLISQLFNKPNGLSASSMRVPDAHWTIEKFHRAIKQVCNVERFQVRNENPIKNHIFCALEAFIK